MTISDESKSERRTKRKHEELGDSGGESSISSPSTDSTSSDEEVIVVDSQFQEHIKAMNGFWRFVFNIYDFKVSSIS